jgi:Ca2+-binding RTX toxin-like protein
MDKSIIAEWHVRKTTMVIVLATVLLALFAGVAYASVSYGTSGDDTFNGTPGSDTYFGKAGNDTISGAGRTDTLLGGLGDDHIYGGDQADVLRGQGGNDHLYGGPDESSPKYTDEYWCGAGFDVVHLSKSEHAPHNFAHNCEKIVKE